MSNELDRLDRLAAEKVMQYELIRDGEVYSWKIGRDELYGQSYILKQEHWRPTRNVSQAWECLEKLNFFQVSVLHDCGGYICALQESPASLISAFCNTAPEAIVRACLRAKEVEV